MSLDTVITIHTKSLLRSRGLAATLQHGAATESVANRVVLGMSEAVATTSREAKFEADTQEVLLLAADYRVAGVTVQPQRGDKFRVTRAGLLLTLEVLPQGDSEQCSRIDASGVQLRVHTKITKREPVV